MPTAEKDPPWSCPDCPWRHKPHPTYGWSEADTRAIEVHRTMFCPGRVIPPIEAAIIELADKWKAEADRAAVRSTTDPNAYLRMTIYERVERETRALLRVISPGGGNPNG